MGGYLGGFQAVQQFGSYTSTQQDAKFVPKLTLTLINGLVSNIGPVVCSDDGLTYVWAGSGYAAGVDISTHSFSQPSRTVAATFTASTNNIQATGIVSSLGLEIGDVIQVSGTTSNNFTLTVETITDGNNIICNGAHKAGNGCLSFTNESASTAIIKRISKWMYAPPGLGQQWVNVTTTRPIASLFVNSTNRPLMVHVICSLPSTGADAFIEVSLPPSTIKNQIYGSQTYAASANSFVFAPVSVGASYQLNAAGTGAINTPTWRELR